MIRETKEQTLGTNVASHRVSLLSVMIIELKNERVLLI